jgi:hypothetical protein
MKKRPANINEMVKEAETGYDVEEIIRRCGGRPSLGTSPSTVESVRLDTGTSEVSGV